MKCLPSERARVVSQNPQEITAKCILHQKTQKRKVQQKKYIENKKLETQVSRNMFFLLFGIWHVYVFLYKNWPLPVSILFTV